MKVLITGADGFIGRNLKLHLAARKDVETISFTRADPVTQLAELVRGVEFVFHLAGVNRPQDPNEFAAGNVNLTRALCDALTTISAQTGKQVPVVFTSSAQATRNNAYGLSKLAAEDALRLATVKSAIVAHIFRLPNVFGKWCKPNYNSAVATFCHNIARGLPIQVNDPSATLTLVYAEDLIRRFLQLVDGADTAVGPDGFALVAPQYTTTVGELAEQLESFRDSRRTLVTERVGIGLVRALYATYVSYLPVEAFAYAIPQYSDSRGVFAEMLKTPDCGQFSFFTAHPGVTRGGHYHHTKTEKFLVMKGSARFKFRHMQTGQTHELVTTGDKSEVVESVPGWAHDITNIGTDEMVVMLWANETFDRAQPDTFTSAV